VLYYIDDYYIQHIVELEILDHIHNENHELNEQLHLDKK
jgi:hypothetical protein